MNGKSTLQYKFNPNVGTRLTLFQEFHTKLSDPQSDTGFL